MSRYVIIGAGAVGGTVAAELYRAGGDVVLVSRRRQLDVLRQRGLDYIRPDGVHRLELTVAGGPDEVHLEPDDVLVVATKSQDTEGVVQQWAWQPVTGRGGTGSGGSAAETLPIVLLQNGIENARTALRRFATVIDGVIMVPSSYVTEGEVVSPGAPAIGAIYLGNVPSGATDRTELVADDFRLAGFDVQVVADIARWKAAKLIGNLAYNADAIWAPSALRDEAQRALEAEARLVLAAAGIDVADLRAESLLDASRLAVQPIPGHPRGGSSTWQSLARAGSLESDFLNGEIVLLARLGGHQAPLNTGVQERLARLGREGAAPGSLGDVDLAELLELAVNQH